MKKLLLDTHVLLWWLGNSQPLSERAQLEIALSANVVFVSVASIWEISIKKSRGKLQAPDDLENALQFNKFELLSITAPHALLAGKLLLHHSDPFDRLLIAQSKVDGLTLVTRDKILMLYDIQTLAA